MKETSPMEGSKLREMIDALATMKPDLEMRVRDRTLLCASIRITPETAQTTGESFEVLLQDVSPSGLGFIHHKPLPLHHTFRAEFSLDCKSVSVLFEVVYCEKMDDGRYRVGGQFVDRALKQAVDEVTLATLRKVILES